MINVKQRFEALDILRGYFIVVIIVDHLNRWPSLLAWLTGSGRLWASAGEGFFIISGLLVGYTRGYKKLQTPLKQVAKLLWKRAFVLYICCVIATAVLFIIANKLHFPNGQQPALIEPTATLFTKISKIITMRYAFEWVYFLKLYVAALVIAPFFIYLFRKGRAWGVVLISCLLWHLGAQSGQDWLQWQILFFLPAIIGFYQPSLASYWQNLSRNKQKLLKTLLLSATVVSIVASAFWVFGWSIVERPHAFMDRQTYVALRESIDPLFARKQLSFGRVLTAFVWFGGLYIIVDSIKSRLPKTLHDLLFFFGERSLTPYIIHGFILLPIQDLVAPTINQWLNLGLALSMVLATYLICRLKIIQRFVPR